MMATIGVVHYNNSSHKLNVLQQSLTNTNNSNNERREIIILRKTPHILPQSKDLDKEDILLTNTARKRPKSGKDVQKNPPPMAVARRNARERNRVKQVNNGFATLRQHIPHTIAAAFESTNGRGGNKKLSKVETLRMAVEYIRSLEDMLASDDASENVSTTSSVSSFPSPPAPSSPALTTSTQMSFTYPVMSPSADSDDISTNPTPPPQQYIQINTSNNTYHLVPAHLYEDSENLEPLQVDEANLTSLIDADLQDLSLLHASDSLSPGMYSESSLSPPSLESNNEFIPVFNSIENLNVKILEHQIKTEPINHQQIKQEDSEALWWNHQEQPSPS